MGTEGTKSDPWTYQCGKCGKLSLIFKSEDIEFFACLRKRLQDQSRARSTHDFLQTRTHTQRKIRNVSSVTPSDNPKDSNSRSKRRRDSCRFVVENDLKKATGCQRDVISKCLTYGHVNIFILFIIVDHQFEIRIFGLIPKFSQFFQNGSQC